MDDIGSETIKTTVEKMAQAGNQAFKDSVEKSLGALNEVNALSKGNIEAVVESLTAEEFQPDKFHDTYRQRVLDMIDAKAAGQVGSRVSRSSIWNNGRPDSNMARDGTHVAPWSPPCM